MFRTPILMTGVVGVLVLLYDAVNHPWSLHSLFAVQNLFGSSLQNGGFILLVILFFRLSTFAVLTKEFYQASQWCRYLGPLEMRPQWTDDFGYDAP